MRCWLNHVLSWMAVLAAFVLISSVTAQQETSPYIEIQSDGLQELRKIAWRPDSQQIAVINGNDVMIFTSNLTEVARLQGHTDRIDWIDWSPDGARLASASHDQTIRIWNLASGPDFGTVITTLTTDNEMSGVFWRPGNHENQLASITLEHLRYLSESTRVYVSIQLWDVSTRQVLYTLPTQVDVALNLEWNSNGTVLVTSGIESGHGYSINFWDGDTGQLIGRSQPYIYLINALAWNPVQDMLMVGSESDTLFAVNPLTREQQGTWEIKSPHVYSLDWSPDGTRLAIGTGDESVKILDPLTGQMIELLAGHNDEIVYVDWSPDGSSLATVSRGNGIRIWDVSELVQPSG